MSTPTPDELAAATALLQSAGADVTVPHSSTLRRREQRHSRNVAVISRSGRSYRQQDGRPYGEVSPSEQRQSDAGPWRANAAIRRDCLPLTIAVAGTVRRIYEVKAWEPDGRKWVAALGEELNNETLDSEYPDFPYRIGDDCPTHTGGAYAPETY